MASTMTRFFDTVTGLQVSDLSSANKLVTDWFFVGAGRKMGATFVWTGTGSPVGACGVEGTNDLRAVDGANANTRAVVGDALDISGFTPPPSQPNGTAGRIPLYFESPAGIIRYTYQRTSGGTGAALVVHVDY